MSEEYTETIATVAVAGASEAIEQSETATEIAVTSAIVSDAAAETAVEAATVAGVAVEGAAVAQEVAVAAAETAYATAAELKTLQDKVDALNARFTAEAEKEEEEEHPDEETPESIPVADEFHSEGGAIANGKRQRRNRFASKRTKS